MYHTQNQLEKNTRQKKLATTLDLKIKKTNQTYLNITNK